MAVVQRGVTNEPGTHRCWRVVTMGPCAWILLRDPLTPQQQQELDAWLHTIGTTALAEPGYWFPIIVRDAKWAAIPLENVSTSCGFGVDIRYTKGLTGAEADATSDFREAASLASVETSEQLGFSPRQLISVSANCKKLIDMQILGCLVLHIATRFNAVVEVTTVRPASHSQGRHRRLLNREPWREFEEIDEYIRQMPGSIMPLYASSGMGHFSYSHIVDVEFLTNWLQNPRFYL